MHIDTLHLPLQLEMNYLTSATIARAIDFVSPGTRVQFAQLCTQLGVVDAYLSWQDRIVAYYAGIGADLEKIRAIIDLLNFIDKPHITNSALIIVSEQEDIIKRLLESHCMMIVFSSEQMRANRATSEAALTTAHDAFRRVFIDAIRPVIRIISEICVEVMSKADALEFLDHLPHECYPGIWDRINHVRQIRDQMQDLLAEIRTPGALDHAILTWDGVNWPMRDRARAAWALLVSANASIKLILEDIATASHPTVTLAMIPAQVARICVEHDSRADDSEDDAAAP